MSIEDRLKLLEIDMAIVLVGLKCDIENTTEDSDKKQRVLDRFTQRILQIEELHK